MLCTDLVSKLVIAASGVTVGDASQDMGKGQGTAVPILLSSFDVQSFLNRWADYLLSRLLFLSMTNYTYLLYLNSPQNIPGGGYFDQFCDSRLWHPKGILYTNYIDFCRLFISIFTCVIVALYSTVAQMYFLVPDEEKARLLDFLADKALEFVVSNCGSLPGYRYHIAMQSACVLLQRRQLSFQLFYLFYHFAATYENRMFFTILSELLLGPALPRIQLHQPVVVKLAIKVRWYNV